MAAHLDGPRNRRMLPEVRWNDDPEHAPMPSGLEVGRLHAVELGGLDRVVLTQRDLEHLVGISVEVAEGEREGAIRVGIPPLVGGRHALAAGTRETERDPLCGDRHL